MWPNHSYRLVGDVSCCICLSLLVLVGVALYLCWFTGVLTVNFTRLGIQSEKPGLLGLFKSVSNDKLNGEFENYHNRNVGEEKNIKEENPAMVNSFYNIVGGSLSRRLVCTHTFVNE